MAGLWHDPILNKVARRNIAAARQWKGIHVYYDRPETDKYRGAKIATPIDDLSATNTGELEYMVLFRAVEDGPHCIVGFIDHVSYYAIEVGIDHALQAFGTIRDQRVWNTRIVLQRNYKLKKGTFNCMTIKFKTPFGPNASSPDNEVEFTINDLKSTKMKFKNNDLRHVTRYLYYNNDSFANVQILEHHIRYNGITAGLPDATGVLEHKNLSTLNMCSISLPGYAIIRGKYKATKTNFKGVSVILLDGVHAVTKVLSVRRANTPVTLRLTTGIPETKVSSENGTQIYAIDSHAHLGVAIQNLEIEDAEFHTGLSQR